MSDPEPRCIVCAAQVDENCEGDIATCPRFTPTGLDANPDDHDDGDDFEDQGGEGIDPDFMGDLDWDDVPDDATDDEDEDPEDNEGEDMPDDFQLEE